uniref:Uncharacterized protein n=1 Tax=Arundo donax TaxID=35708 RepID=A0A0A9H156_ARUDO
MVPDFRLAVWHDHFQNCRESTELWPVQKVKLALCATSSRGNSVRYSFS